MAATTRRGLVITIRGKATTLHFADLGPRDARLVRKETGIALRELLDGESFDLDSVCILWWIARRRAGEHLLSYEQAEDAFPSYLDSQDKSVFSIEAIEDTSEDDGSPEASGAP